VLRARPGARLDLLVTDARISPCVVGIRRAALLWPLGLTQHLSDAQLDAVVAHEIGHVERRDNLAAVGLNAVRVLFWFHPVVWWLDSRWREERERACDERVLARDDDAEQYADGILKVGEFCVGALAMDHARMAGARLTGRIEAIMNPNTPKTLGWTGRTGLTIAMTMAVFGPVMFGATLPTQSTVGDRATATPDQSVTPSKDKGVSGVVTDATGGTIPGATVSVTPVGGTNAQSVVSRADGRFAIADLADGAYDVAVQLPGFRTFTRRVQIGGASGAFLTVELAVGSVTETITVKAVQPEPSPSPISEGEWQEALNRDPGNPRVYFELAHLYYQRERFVESDSLTKRAVDLMTQGLALEPVTRATPGQAVGGNIKEPRKIRDLKPVYPSAALASNVTGVVVLEATIGRVGTVGDVRVLRSVPELDQAAASAVRQWLFTPTYLNGRPIDVTMTVTVNFWK
jgi:TonB family protein